jgi:hypothetical protein
MGYRPATGGDVRRGGLRSAVRARLAAGVALAVVFAIAACQSTGVPAAAPSGGPTATVTVPASPTPTAPPVDPLVTAEVCGLAAAATETTTSIFNEQTDAFELAVARNDEAAMAAAVRAIEDQFESIAKTFPKLAQRPIAQGLRQVLTDVAKAISEMTTLSYTGTTLDIRKKLLDFELALEATCGPLTPPAG